MRSYTSVAAHAAPTDPTRLAATASAASSGVAPAPAPVAGGGAPAPLHVPILPILQPNTEDTGRINVWFRMQNPAFYNTKVYHPLDDLNPEKKLERYMVKNTFIF